MLNGSHSGVGYMICGFHAFAIFSVKSLFLPRAVANYIILSQVFCHILYHDGIVQRDYINDVTVFESSMVMVLHGPIIQYKHGRRVIVPMNAAMQRHMWGTYIHHKQENSDQDQPYPAGRKEKCPRQLQRISCRRTNR
jgi:hypothetical protein